MNTHAIVVDIHQILKICEDADSRDRRVSNAHTFYMTEQALTTARVKQVRPLSYRRVPPPPPRAYFGRDELTERIVGLAENLTAIALIGAGGIGKSVPDSFR